MAFLEWRRFPFFDAHKNVDNGKIAECLQDTKIAVATSGNGYMVLCDVTGWVHLISNKWEVTSFKAYDLTISLAEQLPNDRYLITVGEEEPGLTSLVKVWDWSRLDSGSAPRCARVTRVVPSHQRPTTATALAYHHNKNMIAVGFQDGSVVVLSGDIARQRSTKMKTLTDTGTSPVTGLAFCGADKLYVVSRVCVMLSHLTTERCTNLDAIGAAPHCAVLTSESHNTLTVAHTDAIYVYTSEGRGPCYVFNGEKVRVSWSRNFLAIVTVEQKPSATSTASTSTSTAVNKSHNLTILDIKNKFIVFSKTFDEIDAVITEWGSFYVLTKNKELYYLEEKDHQSKLSLLFKKNLYDVAIRIMMYSTQNHDSEGLMEVYKQYGDHLYSKGDLKGAIDQYVKTIGWLETSYVIRKFLECRHLEPLVTYLEELHKKEFATEDHTTLLLTCYVKIDQQDQQGKLKQFINSKDKTINYDVDVAIKVVRQVSLDDALSLAANHKRHEAYLQIMMDEKKDYCQALRYIEDLAFEDAETYMKKHGHMLIENAPEETTRFLKTLCTGYKPRSQPLVDESSLQGEITAPERSPPDDYIHMFVDNPKMSIEFLEHMIKSPHQCSKLVYNALLEEYIHSWAELDDPEREIISDKIMKVLKDFPGCYDEDHALILCQMLGFTEGTLYLYEENKLWEQQVRLLLRGGQAARAQAAVRRRAAAAPRLWLQLLRAQPPREHLHEILRNIRKEKLLSDILVIDSLASTDKYTLGDVRKYLVDVLTSENEVITTERSLADKYRSESVQTKAHIQKLQNEAVTFQSSKCAACNRPLELPTVHFLCQHSFHQHCFESLSEGECPACGRRAPAVPPPPGALHARLRDPDPYAVVSEYFGRGLFNKVTVVTEPTTPEAPPPVSDAPPISASVSTPLNVPPQNYGAGAEARLRLQEGQSKQVFVPNTSNQMAPKGSSIIPVPEGRMRLIEQQKYASSLEANISKLEPVHKASPVKKEASGSPKISAAIANETNPFEYDDAKNPFADADTDDATNPFAEEEDYDNNLNPFS